MTEIDDENCFMREEELFTDPNIVELAVIARAATSNLLKLGSTTKLPEIDRRVTNDLCTEAEKTIAVKIERDKERVRAAQPETDAAAFILIRFVDVLVWAEIRFIDAETETNFALIVTNEDDMNKLPLIDLLKVTCFNKEPNADVLETIVRSRVDD